MDGWTDGWNSRTGFKKQAKTLALFLIALIVLRRRTTKYKISDAEMSVPPEHLSSHQTMKISLNTIQKALTRKVKKAINLTLNQ